MYGKQGTLSLLREFALFCSPPLLLDGSVIQPEESVSQAPPSRNTLSAVLAKPSDYPLQTNTSNLTTNPPLSASNTPICSPSLQQISKRNLHNSISQEFIEQSAREVSATKVLYSPRENDQTESHQSFRISSLGLSFFYFPVPRIIESLLILSLVVRLIRFHRIIPGACDSLFLKPPHL